VRRPLDPDNDSVTLATSRRRRGGPRTAPGTRLGPSIGLDHADTCIHGDVRVDSFEAGDIEDRSAGLLFPANHRSTSDRSHPPEACLLGNRPLLVQRKRVDRLTPTTRRTSAVLILWSSGASRSGFGTGGIAGRGARSDEPHGPKRRGSWRGRAAPSRLGRRRCARGVSFERRMAFKGKRLEGHE
jgi:hypothetical protein